MSINLGVMPLYSSHISPSCDLCRDRLQIEDNIGEAIHIHLRNLRVDLTIDEFLAVESAVFESLCNLVRRKTVDLSLLDRSFLGDIAVHVPYLESMDIVSVPLDELLIIERHAEGRKLVVIEDSIPFRCLEGDTIEYEQHMSKYSDHVNPLDQFAALARRARHLDYPCGGHIVIFGDEPYVRDGQHRAALLLKRHGHTSVPVLRIGFSLNYRAWRLRHNSDSCHDMPPASHSESRLSGQCSRSCRPRCEGT